MGNFGGIGKTELFERGVFLTPGGGYTLEIDTILLKETRKAGLAFIVEFKVLESTLPNHAEGSKATWFQKMQDKDVAFPAITEFFIALYDIPRKGEDYDEFMESLEDVLDGVTEDLEEGEEHPLKGKQIKCTTHTKLTKGKGVEFTVHNWEHCPE